MNFDDLEPKSIEVTLGRRKYVLSEATESTARKYDNHILAKAPLADLRVLLVSECLTLDGKRVPPSVVEGWRHQVVEALYDKACEMSAMGQYAPKKGAPDAASEGTSPSAESSEPSSTS